MTVIRSLESRTEIFDAFKKVTGLTLAFDPMGANGPTWRFKRRRTSSIPVIADEVILNIDACRTCHFFAICTASHAAAYVLVYEQLKWSELCERFGLPDDYFAMDDMEKVAAAAGRILGSMVEELGIDLYHV